MKKLILLLLIVNPALWAFGQEFGGHFERVFITSRSGEQIELHDVTLRYLRRGLLAEAGPVSLIGDDSEIIAWDNMLAITAAPIDERTGWHIVLTSGRVLPGLHGDLYIEGTRVGTIEPSGDSRSFSAVITSYDDGGLDYTSVVIPQPIGPCSD